MHLHNHNLCSCKCPSTPQKVFSVLSKLKCTLTMMVIFSQYFCVHSYHMHVPCFCVRKFLDNLNAIILPIHLALADGFSLNKQNCKKHYSGIRHKQPSQTNGWF